MTAHNKQAFDRVVRTVCSPNCLGTCGINAFVKDDRIIKVEPASFPDPGFERICARGISMATQRLHHPDRLTHPLIREGKRGDGKWRKASWDEAYDHIVERQAAIAEKHGWRSNAWLSGSGNYGFRANNSAAKTAHTLGGTLFTYFAICGDFAGMMGYHAMLGSFANSNDISEVKGAKYFLSVGKNVADTAHSDMHFLFDAMDNGTRFVMIDPRFSRGAAKADEWVAPRPGTDTALALGMINVIVSEGLIKEDYLLQHTNAPFLVNTTTGRVLRERDIFPGGGNEALVWDRGTDNPAPASLATSPALSGTWEISTVNGTVDCSTAWELSLATWRQYTPEYASSICDVPAAQIRHTAIDYATSDPAWLWLGLGPQRYSHGHTVARAWVTLATVCGNIGKPYGGVSIYDAANLALVINPHNEWLKPEGTTAPSLPGTQVVDIIASGEPYPVKSLWLHSYGFATQTPFYKRFIEEALPELDLLVVSEQMMTPAARIADVVLPVVSYYEDDWDLVGGGENWYVQLRRQAVPPVGESRNDYSIFQELCERHGKGDGWKISPEEDCKRILATHPDPRIRSVDWETLKRDGVAKIDVPRPFTPFRDMKFNTPSGRIELYQEQFADIGEGVLDYREQAEGQRSEKAKTYPMVLITYKDVHSTHSQHFNLPYIREMVPEPMLDISPADAAARNIRDGDVVTVFNERGQFSLRANVGSGVQPGTLALPQGWLQGRFIDGHPSDLGHVPPNEAQNRMVETNYPAWDILCDVRPLNTDSSPDKSR